MIVCNDYGNGAGKNRGLEHFARRHRAACGRSGCRNIKAYNLMLSIKKEHHKVLTDIVGEHAPDKFRCPKGSS
jgi:hypothetical protein